MGSTLKDYVITREIKAVQFNETNLIALLREGLVHQVEANSRTLAGCTRGGDTIVEGDWIVVPKGGEVDDFLEVYNNTGFQEMILRL